MLPPEEKDGLLKEWPYGYTPYLHARCWNDVYHNLKTFAWPEGISFNEPLDFDGSEKLATSIPQYVFIRGGDEEVCRYSILKGWLPEGIRKDLAACHFVEIVGPAQSGPSDNMVF